uniref:EGF-like domain-containing protein n=1 Tax=Pyramimonas obovata TaxID=1411642 RepID=A0A6T7WP01_9CHLO|mmetsp:Transcript_28136/g.61607  ORF Transcript_28136/g.61607 Transcript_28136/m.61607 type:complete len:522 (+) Transcript_28136:2214-3779(+)
MRAGGHHLHGRHAISTSHLEGLSPRSWLFIAIAVFIVLSTLDLERRLHHHNDTIDDDLPPKPIEVRHLKHVEPHGRSPHGSRHKKYERPKPGELETKADPEQTIAAGRAYGLSEPKEDPTELEFQDQSEDTEDKEEEPWNIEEESLGGVQFVPKGVREQSETREDAPARERATQRASERAAERAARLRQAEEKKREAQREQLKKQVLAASSEADRGVETCEMCRWHGMCTFDGNCICAALWSGKSCESLTEFHRPKAMENFKEPYSLHDFIMTSRNLENQSSIWVARNPGKPDSEKTKIADVTRTLLKALPEEDPLSGILFKSCAVVGSSGILLLYDHGDEIDNHDAVFRFNSAPTRGYESKVGSRTTVRLTNSRNFGFRENPTEQVYQHMRVAAGLNKMLNHRRRQPHLQLYGMHPKFHSYVDESFNFLATSGLVGVVIALHKCAKVELYGFQVHPRHGVQYHYYSEADAPANEGRDDVEWLAVKALVSAGLVSFGEPCIIECHTSELWCENCQKELEAN